MRAWVAWVACAALAFVAVPATAGEVADALAKRAFADAVAAAKSPAELRAAVIATKDVTAARGVARHAAALRGPFREHGPTAEWLAELAAAFKGDSAIELLAGYVRLVGDQPAKAAEAFARAVKTAPDAASRAQAATYLADAHEKAGATEKAVTALGQAVAASPAANPYRSQVGQRIAVRLQRAGDLRYADMLESVGEPLLAAHALAAQLESTREVAVRAVLLDRVQGLFAKGLNADSPAASWWGAAKVATGDERFRYLVETVARGANPRDEYDHAFPDALLALALECAKRGRPIAAAALAKRRLQVGDCPAAWDLLESLPAKLSRR